MDTQPIDTTDILARPREYAAKLETMRSALEAVTAQLAAVTAERDAARAEVARLTAALETYNEAREMVLKALPAVAINETEELWGASNTALVRKALSFLWHCAALRGDTAPAQPTRLYGKYRVSKADGTPTDPTAEYFVLRIDTDPAARHALSAYADYITFSAPEFCDDLRQWLRMIAPTAPARAEEYKARGELYVFPPNDPNKPDAPARAEAGE